MVAEWGYTTVPAKYQGTRLLAVAMEERHPTYPDVPTFKELGFDLVSGAYRGIAVPSSTPEDVRQKLADMIDQINKDDRFIKNLTDGGFAVINVKYGPDLDAFMDKAKKDFAAAAKTAGVIQ